MKFEDYIKNGEIVKTNVDLNRFKSLIKIAEKRFEFSKQIKIANFKIENAYEAIIELIEAILAKEGFKSYSHLADIAFIQNKIKPESRIKLEWLRNLRHKSKYYGLEIDENLANRAMKIAEEIFEEIKKLI